ncbi:MAG: I78 family peptidase inhibitor [Halomonas sp.]|nr:I78 family peptidase inhibitor [Halomonas sp.]
MPMRMLAGLLVTGLLAACASEPPVADAPRPPPMAQSGGTCDASQVEGHIGEAYREAMQPALLAHSGAQRLRVIRPDQGYTMDYRPERLNVHVDEAGEIIQLRCG